MNATYFEIILNYQDLLNKNHRDFKLRNSSNHVPYAYRLNSLVEDGFKMHLTISTPNLNIYSLNPNVFLTYNSRNGVYRVVLEDYVGREDIKYIFNQAENEDLYDELNSNEDHKHRKQFMTDYSLALRRLEKTSFVKGKLYDLENIVKGNY